jgi:hypothetical protein
MNAAGRIGIDLNEIYRFNDQDSPAKRQAVQQVRRHFVDERN